jgi:hypothetical protein
MYEMVAGQPPFRAKTLKDLNRKILNDKVLLPKFLSSEVRRISRQLLITTIILPQQGTQATYTACTGILVLLPRADLVHVLLSFCLYAGARGAQGLPGA